mgnify:CR=1 FL=1
MASRIQGITVEIGGDTTKLSKALESVNKSIKGTQSGLKDVNKLLKLDPSNTELVVQKQKMLKDAIEATKEKLATLKTAAQQANEQLANGEITQQQYDALQREIVETEQNLRSLQDQAATTNATLAKIDEAGEKLQNIGSSVENVGKKFLPVTAAVSSNANTNVSMMGETFKYCAPIADALGFSAEDTAEAIGLMANSGIKVDAANSAVAASKSEMDKTAEMLKAQINANVKASTDKNANYAQELVDVRVDDEGKCLGVPDTFHYEWITAGDPVEMAFNTPNSTFGMPMRILAYDAGTKTVYKKIIC